MERLYEEIAFIAFHFHWARQTIMNMEHKERQKWCQQINSINDKLNSNEKKPKTQSIFSIK
ncbi:DUF6760 family protein [Candidatus Uabimicrobium amorphum]|uniref:DUF6760 family protein n=1 Tax=Uabimicrobium amorphum TaxID=2596890 RepID=UPI0034A475AF